MPGTSEQLEAAGCTTAKAVVKSTIEMLSVEGVGRPIWGSNPRRGDEARCIGSHLACIGRHGCRDRALLRPRQQRRHPEEQAAERGVAARARRLPAGTAAGCERASTPLPDPAPTRPRRACAPNWSRLRPLGAALAHRGGARAVGRRGLLLAENAHDGALQRRLGRQARPPRERNGVPSASKGRFEAQAAPPWPGSPPEQLGGSPWPQEPASASGARRGPPRSCRFFRARAPGAVGLNSNHWTPSQANEQMRQAQLQWLPRILGRQGESSGCSTGFLIVSHIGVVCRAAG